MKINEILEVLEAMAPLAYAEDFDNTGLLTGNPNTDCTGILVCHDALEEVIDEAVKKNCNLVVCFHPIIFKGLKSLTGRDYVERAVIKAIRNDIAIYSVHTALDNHRRGVNKIICDTLGLTNTKILIPKEKFIRKLVTYTVADNFVELRNALFDAGAGQIGNYDDCSFSSKGIGTYMGNENSNPEIGNRFEFVQSEEIKLEVTFEKHQQAAILKALFAAHLYEEVAYEIYELENAHQHIGLGMIGDLPQPTGAREFLMEVRDKMQCGGIRHSALMDKPVERIAVLGGSGAFAIPHAIRAGADVLVTADLKYHDYYQAEGKIVLADIGHYESERFTKNYIVDFLKKKIPNFAIILSELNTNPVKYL